MGNAMDKLKNRMQTTDVAQTPVGQSLLEQGATVRQMRLDNYLTAVAVQQPREKSLVIKEVEFEATLLGEKAYYSWTAKGKRGRALIEGPSVDLAMVLAREWGNCATRADLVDETATHFLFDGIFMDLERGVTIVRQFRQVKSRDMGQMDEDRSEDIVFQVGQSKALRNAVCAAMPAWLIDKALKKAKQSAAKSFTPELVVEAFKKWEIDQKTLERKVGKATKRWDDMDMAQLRGVYQSLLDGITSIDNEFDADMGAAAVTDATEKAAKKATEKAEKKKAEAEEEKESKDSAGDETAQTTPPDDQEAKDTPPEEGSKEAAKKAAAKDHSDPTPAGKKAIAAFDELGITRQQLEAKMEKSAGEWKRAELNKLKTMIQAIKDGDVEQDVLFPPEISTSEIDDGGGEWND